MKLEVSFPDVEPLFLLIILHFLLASTDDVVLIGNRNICLI